MNINNTPETNPLPMLRRRYLHCAVYGLLILFVCVWQSTRGLIPEIYGARPLLAVPLTVMIAFYTGPAGGATAGCAAGLIWGVSDIAHLMGYHALILMLTGCIAGLLVQNLLRNNLMAVMLVMICVLSIHSLLDWSLFYLLPAVPEAQTQLLRQILPNAAYTLAVSPLFYGLITLVYRKAQKKDNY